LAGALAGGRLQALAPLFAPLEHAWRDNDEATGDWELAALTRVAG